MGHTSTGGGQVLLIAQGLLARGGGHFGFGGKRSVGDIKSEFDSPFAGTMWRSCPEGAGVYSLVNGRIWPN